jgi:hypothetical protein
MKELISIAILAAAMTAGVAQAQGTQADRRLQIPWSDPSRPGLVKVELLNGSITIRTHPGKDVIINSGAVARRGPARTSDGLTRIDGTGGSFKVEEANNVMDLSNMSPFGTDNVDIQVPVKTNLKLMAVSGSILVDGVDGDLEVQGLNGPVRLLNVTGSVVANSMNDKLTVTLRDVLPNRMMSFASMNSSVDVTLPATTKANVKIVADNGNAYTDFEYQPIANPNPSQPTATRGRGGATRYEIEHAKYLAINGGGSEIELRSINGSVSLRKAK